MTCMVDQTGDDYMYAAGGSQMRALRTSASDGNLELSYVSGVEESWEASEQKSSEHSLACKLVSVVLLLLASAASACLYIAISGKGEEASTIAVTKKERPEENPSDLKRPSLYCFQVIEPSEMKLVQWQFQHWVGIFLCDEWSVFTDKPPEDSEATLIGTYANGHKVWSTPIPGPPAQRKPGQNTWLLNNNVFMRAWDVIIRTGVAARHSWTVKVDADTVFHPYRLLANLQQLNVSDKPLGNLYLNCKKYWSMQGSMEVISQQALRNFAVNNSRCKQSMDWYHYAEDQFLMRCLDKLGARFVQNFGSLNDRKCKCTTAHTADNAANLDSCGFDPWGKCLGESVCWASCHEPDYAAFHSFKDVDAWSECWSKMRKVGPSTPLQPFAPQDHHARKSNREGS